MTGKAILTIVEEVDFKKLAQQQASSQVSLNIPMETFQKLYEYLEIVFDQSKDKFTCLVSLMESAKDLQCYAVIEKVERFLKANYSEEWAKYLQGHV